MWMWKGVLGERTWCRKGHLHCAVLQLHQLSSGPSVVPNSATPWTAAHQASLTNTTPGAYSSSCPLIHWYHETISSSVVPFSSHLQSFPASGPFHRRQFFVSSGQSIGVSASISVLPMNTQLISFRMYWLDLLAAQETQEFSPTPQFKRINSSVLSFLHSPTLTSYMTTGKTIALTRRTFVGKVSAF